MALKLIKGSYEYKEQIVEMIEEWKEYNDTHDTNRSPWAIFENDWEDFDYYISNLETSEPKDVMENLGITVSVLGRMDKKTRGAISQMAIKLKEINYFYKVMNCY